MVNEYKFRIINQQKKGIFDYHVLTRVFWRGFSKSMF